MVLEKKEIQPVHPNGTQSWIFIERTDTEAEAPILWPPDGKELTHWKRPWCWERLRAEGKGDDRGWNDWMASLTQWTWVWTNSARWWRTGKPGVLQFTGQQRVGHNWVTEQWQYIKQITNKDLQYQIRDQISRSVVSDSLQLHGLQYARLPCPSPSPGAYSDSCPLSQWCCPTISSSVIPFSSCRQSFPASRSFLMNQLFTSSDQSIGVSASASVLPMNIQDWFPLG